MNSLKSSGLNFNFLALDTSTKLEWRTVPATIVLSQIVPALH
jgi:hypothetical protein